MVPSRFEIVQPTDRFVVSHQQTGNKESGAGSGNFVPFQDASSHASRSEAHLGISNPRVLSDMGLAIPRPTRLGDPRSSSGSREIIISFGNPSQHFDFTNPNA
jgi:hypothetical protein